MQIIRNSQLNLLKHKVIKNTSLRLRWLPPTENSLMKNCHPFAVRWRSLAVAICAIAYMASVHGEQALPEGSKGWWYFTFLNDVGHYTTDPITACQKTAQNHMGQPLVAMRPAIGSDNGAVFDCAYSHFIGAPNSVHWYGQAILNCDQGYVPSAPGVCVKHKEAPAPAGSPGGCNGGGGPGSGPGATRGNPVQVASGAKVQTEIDLVAGPHDAQRVNRTYRSLHQNWNGQSAGVGWSFSFDRYFTVDRGAFNTGEPIVTGGFGDGSVFAFQPRSDGTFASQYDKGLSLKALNADYSDWLLTTADGHLERYKKLNGVFRMISSHSADGDLALYSYNADGQLQLIAGADGRTVKVVWEGDAVVAIEGPSGSVRYEYEQAAVEGQEAITGMARLIAVHFHNRDGALDASRRYHYEQASNRFLLTGITDENGARFATYAYDDFASTVLSEHAGGVERYTFDYSSDSARRITDPLGTERILNVSYFRDTRGRITSESQPAGAGCSAGANALTYADDGALTSTADFNGNKTCFATDAARGLETRRITGLPASAACPAGTGTLPSKTARMISTQWHPDWPMKSAVAEPNRITTYVYNGEHGIDGQVAHCAPDAPSLPNQKPIAVLCSVSVQATADNNGALGFAATKTGAARTWQYAYNGQGQLLTQTGPAGASGNVDSVRLTYFTDTSDSHASGDLASIVNGAGEETQFREYSKSGMATRIRQANGQIVRFEFGARQRLVASTLEDGGGADESTRYEYDDAGQLTRVVAPDGSAIEYAYDPAHRLTDLRDNIGNTVHFTLDKMGNVIHQEVRGPSGDLVMQAARSYDALNRLQRQQRDGTDAGMNYGYDRGGNLTTMTDPLGRVTNRVFDSHNRVLAQTLPPAKPGTAAPVIRFGYSQHDQLLSVTDPRQLMTRYTVDGFGQRTAVVSPDTGTTTSQFDGAGNPDFSTDADGRKTTYRFDSAQRITQIGSSTFEYGKGGSGSTGRLTAMNDDSGQSSYAYDGFGRLLAKRQTVGAGATAKTFVLAYTYGSSGNSAGHVTSMTYPSGNRIDIAYGSDGRAISLAVTGPGTAAVPILGDIRYLPFGAVRSWSWGNSTAASPNLYQRGFDLDGRIVSYPLGHLANDGTLRTLSYDAAGRITASKHTGSPKAALLDQRFEYDGLDRLIAFDSISTNQRFQYDANGNRTQATFGANTYSNTISAASNRLDSTTGPAPARQNAYDAAGNLTTDGTIQYLYGTNGRLGGVVAGGIATGYRYNGMGQRVAKTGAGGVAVHYVYDEAAGCWASTMARASRYRKPCTLATCQSPC